MFSAPRTVKLNGSMTSCLSEGASRGWSFEVGLDGMGVQTKVWGRIAGQECSYLFDPFSYFTGEGRGLHLQRGVAVAMHDLAQVYLTSKLRTAGAHRTQAAACVPLQVC